MIPLPTTRRPAICLVVFASCLVLFLDSLAWAKDKNPGFEFFETRIRPVFVEHCQECHSGEEPDSKLSIESLAGLLRGGTRGPAIVPGDPKKSLLILAVNHADQQLHMPPKKKLPTRTLSDLAAWIKMGAPWTNAKPTKPAATRPAGAAYKITDEQRAFWSFRPVERPEFPSVRNDSWGRNGIDRFVLSRLEAAGMRPAPRADRRTLIRRLYLDLIGLPPTPEEIETFLADRSPLAYRRVVDRLLASPQYGERWARHWLDVARYADSNGLDENLAYANAFRYRDYVVQAMNKDKPYNRFIVEQLAGDLLPANDPVDVAERTTATGFLSLGAKMLAEDDPIKMQMDIIDEQVDTTGRAFLGLTLGCARCHDHKFDPIPTADYYSLAGIFKSTKTMENFKVVAVWQERPVGDPERVARQAEVQAKVQSLQVEIDAAVAAGNEQVKKQAAAKAGEYFAAASARLHLEQMAKHVLPKPRTRKVDAPGAIMREAETFERGNISRLTTGYGEGIGVIAGPGGKNTASFDLQVKKAGWYLLLSRYAAAQSRPTNFFADGQLAISGGVGKVTGSWYPDTQKWFVEGTVYLKAGKVVFALERNGPIPHIDQFVFVPAAKEFSSQQDAALAAPILAQWTDYLTKTMADSKSPFAVLHAVESGKPVSSLTAPAKDVVNALKLNDESSLSEVTAALKRAVDDIQRGKVARGLESLQQVLLDPQGPLRLPAGVESIFSPATKETIASRKMAQDALKKQIPPMPVAMAVSDAKAEDLRIHIRGSHVTLGDVVPRRFPQILAPERKPLSNQASGRLELARWIGSKANPLAPRVIANRVWQWHFGYGLVRSPDNFGRLGQLPTHPELLDYLAHWLMDHDWSLKKLHRLIVLSSTYQMSTKFQAQYNERDPENHLLWRMNRRRMEAEVLRDALLNVGEELDLQMGGTLLRNKNREYVTSSSNVDPAIYRTRRRSLYLPVVRSALYDFFQAFDFADPTVMSGERKATTAPSQALFMMNSQFVATQSRLMAERIMRSEDGDAGRVRLIYRRALGRAPTSSEAVRAIAFVRRYRAALEAQGAEKKSSDDLPVWRALCRSVLSTNEFLFID